jgi:hypothetical protein
MTKVKVSLSAQKAFQGNERAQQGANTGHKFGRFAMTLSFVEAPRSSPISLSGKNPQNCPQIRNNLSLKSAIPDKAVMCHSCDPAKCVTYSEKNSLGPHTGLLLSHIQSIQYIATHKMYIRVLSLPLYCALSPQLFTFIYLQHILALLQNVLR